MISAYFDESSKKVNISFTGSKFHDLVEVLKDNRVAFDPALKTWQCTAGKFLNILKDINEIEIVNIPSSTMELLERYKVGFKETAFIRKAFRPELLKSPPLGKYQEEDIRKLIMQNRMICGHDVGLGKTFIAISAMNHLMADGDIKRIFVVTVPETVYNWKRELKMFGNFTDEEILIVNKDNRNVMDNWEGKKAIITTYNTMLLISDHYYKAKTGKKSTAYKISPIDFNLWDDKLCLILDEGHKCKNPKSRTYKVINLHKKFFNYRYALTATPYPNDITEIWALMSLLDEGILGGNYYEFLGRVAILGTRFSEFAISRFKSAEVEKVVDELKPFLIRRFKKECLPDLPELAIKRIYVEASDKLRKLYQDIIVRELGILKEKDGRIVPSKVVSKFPYLSLVCSDPCTLRDKFDNSWNFDLIKRINEWRLVDNPKLEAVDSILSEHEGEKIIIWSTHPGTLDSIADNYRGRNPIVIHGNTDSGKLDKSEFRDNELTRFRTSKDCNLAIISPLCMGVGVNIPESSVAVHWDRNWSSVVYLQSLGRNHRATSKKDVVNYILIMDETLELNQDGVLEGKNQLNSKLMMKDVISSDDWKAIFRGKLDIDIGL